MPSCACGKSFQSDDSLAAHRADTKQQLTCAVCQLIICGASRFAKHKHWSCPQCDFDCTVRNDLEHHQKAAKHWHCQLCSVSFDVKAALRRHLKLPPHIVEFRCCECDRSFKNANALEMHMKDAVKRHEKIKLKRSTFCCESCSRNFKDEKALRAHLDSAKHRPLSDLPCIAGLPHGDNGASCECRFTSPSALLHHLESGTCPSGMDREQLNLMIIANDTDQIITSHSGGLRSPTESITPSTESGGVILTPGSELSVSEFFQVLPNVPGLRCPLCPTKRRQFPSKKALDQHMQSIAHAALDKIFHCPVSLLRGSETKAEGKRTTNQQKKQKHFATASGLAQHLESGACDGGKAGLKTAMEYIEAKLRQRELPVTLLV